MIEPSVTIDELLRTTSRTFALAIPLLPSPIDEEITISYLLFRIADTLEDADQLPSSARQAGLIEFVRLLTEASEKEIEHWSERWRNQEISHNSHYNRLMCETPQVFRRLREFAPGTQQIIVEHTSRSALGMAEMLQLGDELGQVRMQNIPQLQQYCYYVAGIVGELITELMVQHVSSLRRAIRLKQLSRQFGEGLQLVNILKDSDDDRCAGRAYIPPQVARQQVFALANTNLDGADHYVSELRRCQAPPGCIAFCDAPLQLARASLQVVSQRGPGAKIPREEVFALLHRVIDNAGLKAPLAMMPFLNSC